VNKQKDRQTDGQTNNQTAPNVLATLTNSPLVTDYMTVYLSKQYLYLRVTEEEDDSVVQLLL